MNLSARKVIYDLIFIPGTVGGKTGVKEILELGVVDEISSCNCTVVEVFFSNFFATVKGRNETELGTVTAILGGKMG
mgnify:CR=1 FL=1